MLLLPFPQAALSAWAWGRSLAEIVVSNPTGIVDVCLLWVLCHNVEVSAMSRLLV